METASSRRRFIRPLVMNVRISRFSIHLLHLELFVACPSAPFSLLSIINFFKLPRCRRSGPRYIASTVTVDVYDLPSWRKSTSKLLAGSVSLRKDISEGDTVLVCIFLRLKLYSDRSVYEALYALEEDGDPAG